jgi:hypothetical protein
VVRLDNVPGAPVVIVSARLRSRDDLTEPHSGLPVFAIRNVSREMVSQIRIGVWNSGQLDARIRYRVPLSPGEQVTIDPALGSPNVFGAAVVRPTIGILSVDLADGRRWAPSGAPDVTPVQRE